MSATNRGIERKSYDFYATPIDVVENLLNNIDLNQYGNTILEPSAGNGNVCSVIKRYYPSKTITALEIRIEEVETLIQNADEVIIGDYLELDIASRYSIIIFTFVIYTRFIYAEEMIKSIYIWI